LNAHSLLLATVFGAAIIRGGRAREGSAGSSLDQRQISSIEAAGLLRFSVKNSPKMACFGSKTELF